MLIFAARCCSNRCFGAQAAANGADAYADASLDGVMQYAYGEDTASVDFANTGSLTVSGAADAVGSYYASAEGSVDTGVYQYASGNGATAALTNSGSLNILATGAAEASSETGYAEADADIYAGIIRHLVCRWRRAVLSSGLAIGTSPQLFTACAAYAVGAAKRIPYVFELRDLWPESIRAVGAVRHPGIINALERLELFLYRKAAAIVAVTHAFRRNLIGRGIDGAKIHVVTNGVDTGNFAPQPKAAEMLEGLGLTGKFVAGYIGTHGMAHALETILDAADHFHHAPDGADYRFVLLGDGASKAALVEQARVRKLDNIIFLDSVPKQDVARLWSILDVSIIHLRKTPLFETVIPSKLFECMAMGIPVLHGVTGESADIVSREEIGLLFEPENAAELCAQLRRLHDDAPLRRRLRQRCIAATGHYERTRLAGDMLDIINHLVTGQAPSPAIAASSAKAA